MTASAPDPLSYKESFRQEWQRTAQGWHDWIAVINAWLADATEQMLLLAGAQTGRRVLDLAAGDGRQSLAVAEGYVLATDIASNFVTLTSQLAHERYPNCMLKSWMPNSWDCRVIRLMRSSCVWV